MERRSGRRGQDSVREVTPTPSPVRRGIGGKGTPQRNVTSPPPEVIPANEVPVVGAEEVVLNRRGVPARQRKRNRFYFDDDMVTPDNWGSPLARNSKKVKTEPVDTGSDEDDTEGEDILESMSPLGNSRASSGRSRASQSPSPVKSPSRAQSQKKVVENPGRRTPARQTPASPQRGNRQPSLQLITVSPEKSPKHNKSATKAPAPPKVTKGAAPVKVKIEPDVPPEPVSQRKLDKWGKLVNRANVIQEDRDQAAKKKKDGLSKDDGQEKKTPKKELQRQQQERERLQKEKEKKDALLKQKEEERLAKERAQKEKEKKAQQKEKKRDHRDSITVLPPVQKLASRALITTTDDEHHPQIPIAPHQLMAVIKIDDPTTQVIDKRVAHDISIRLRNLLKLPKAHKWVCYEWFYSNIDKVLFEGENDFQICLKESFPALKARKLTRTEWTKIRRLMGKPRRCSQAFFDEEREELARRRSKIRQIQQRKVTDFNYKELPDEIPLQLVIGTKVTARLRRPQDGLFTGTIEGVDTSNNTYRITFDRPGLGTHSIPDYEVLSNDTPETVSTSSFALKIPRRSGGFTVGTFKFQNPALLGEQPEGFPKSPFPADGMLGGFPIRLLDMIVRLSKLLKAKREKIMTLKELNVEAEKMKSYGRPYNSEYRTRYARCVLDLDSMNKEMAMYLEGIQTYCLEITTDHGATTQMVIPEHILDSSRQEASMVVSTYNCKANRTLVHNQKIVGLVHHLTSLLLQVRALSSSDRNLYELKSIKDTIKDVKASLEGKNLQCFQNKIEIPMNRIIAGLCVTQPKAY